MPEKMLKKTDTPLLDAVQEARFFCQASCVFERGVTAEDQLPIDGLPEIAFVGRSNVGKSSLINALVCQKGLARASNTPGRTQELNFFNLNTCCHIVDLPGYGYAAAPRKTVQAWTRLIHAYLRGRVQLKRVFLLIDARHGIKTVDENIMKMLDSAAVTYQLVLTKADKISPLQAEKILKQTESQGRMHVACYPDVLLTSSVKNTGMDAVRLAFFKAVNSL